MWYGNHQDRERPAKFRPADDQDPKVVYPATAFQPDAAGGYGVPSLTGDRHDVLARDNPPWAAQVLESVIAAGKPLRAIKIGSAGKYRFWRLAAPTAESALEEADKLAEEAAARAEAVRIIRLHRLREAGYTRDVGDQELVYRTADEEPLPAVAVYLGTAWAIAKPAEPALWWDASGEVHEEPIDGLRVLLEDGSILAALDQRRQDWHRL